VIPIPGTTKIENLKSNLHARFVKLPAADIEQLNKLFAVDSTQGDRYANKHGQFQTL
jgi:aryl-alcohol dehydrogenase-like predicted oxidoreductase